MREFKLVAIDMDGTLLNNDLKISARAKKAIQAVQQKGIYVTLCTGRMYASALPYAEEMKLDVPLITYNGAYVKNSGTGEVLYEKHLGADYARLAYEIARKYDLHVNVYHKDKLYMESQSQIGKKYAKAVRVPIYTVDNMQEFLREDPIKLVIIGAPDKLDRLSAIYEKEFQQEISFAKSSATFLEVGHLDATKGHGLHAVAEHFQIARKNIMGIGDNFNDLDMFDYAGFSVVMGNGEEKLKELADYVTCCNDDDGVAEALEKLILEV